MTEGQATAFAATALANVTRLYPRHVSHLLAGREEIDERALHPVFYGSYDWHSAVHMHWLLVRVLRLHPPRDEVAALLERQFTDEKLDAELAYFNREGAGSFERPYGWAWLLELHAELLRLGNRAWIERLQPQAAELARRMTGFVAGAPYPIRAGTHGNTAFACVLALDYAQTSGDSALETAIAGQAKAWYGADHDAPLAYEPSLDDFLSPSLIEAVLMRQVLPADDFRAWRNGFFSRDPAAALAPPRVADRADPKQAHLDGLALSRAWCFRRLGHAQAAERHLAAALPHAVGGHYVGSHWLASFAALALGERP